MTSPLDLTEGKIRTHWVLFAEAMSDAGLSAPAIAEVFTTNIAIGQLSGPGAESSERQRGGRALALPLGVNSGRGSQFWVSYLEEWDFLERNSYRFRSASFTFYQNDGPGYSKAQLFRAEWPGFTNWGSGAPNWQAPGAGHPHWQFDALSSYVSDETREQEVRRLVRLLKNTSEVEEFDPVDAPAARELAYQSVDTDWTKMHFASQTNWSNIAFNGTREFATHTHAPSEPIELRSWAKSVIIYVKQELRA